MAYLYNNYSTVAGLGVASEVVLSFSVLSNGRKILDCGTAPKDSLTCVHGLRFLSLAWVIMVHTYLQIFAIAGGVVDYNFSRYNWRIFQRSTKWE